MQSVDELVSAIAANLQRLLAEFAEDGKFGVPLPPSDIPPGTNPELLMAYYSGVIDAASTLRKDATAAAVAAKQLEETRRDGQTLVQARREDTQTALDNARRDADRSAEAALIKSVHDGYITVASGALDRAMKRAEFLTTVVAGIAGVYTTLLGLVYGISDRAKPLPPRALWPVVFLALALGFSVVYTSFIRRSGERRRLLPTGSGGLIPQMRLETFFEWTFAGVLQRGWALRLSVVSFACGIALLPLPFITLSSGWATVAVVVAGGALVTAGIAELILFLRRSGRRAEDEVPNAQLTRYL